MVGAGYEVRGIRIAFRGARIAFRGTRITLRGTPTMGAHIFFIDLPLITGLTMAITGLPLQVRTASGRFNGRELSVIEREPEIRSPGSRAARAASRCGSR
jgi:hypothetical protein